MYHVEALRAHFPSLAGGTAYFDGPGGTQTPDVVGDAIRHTLTQPLSNRGDLTPAERNADAVVLGARRAMADLLGTVPEGVVFGRSMTQLTMDVSRALAKEWGPGDEVVVTRSASPRAMDVEELAEIARDVFGEERVHVAERLDDALQAAVDAAEQGTEDGFGAGVLVTGSVALVGEARVLLRADR